MKTLLSKLLARLGIYTKAEVDSHWTEGFFAGVKAAGIGITRDRRGRFVKSK